ncbi:MAG: FmdB family zinc ribbon protein, partial [Candidatus Methanomethylicaceae archaeon]
MPTYLYRCSKCQKRFEFVLPTRQRNSKEGTLCECGGRLVRSLIEEMKQSATHVFVPGWFEHIDVEPVYISSREQLW